MISIFIALALMFETLKLGMSIQRSAQIWCLFSPSVIRHRMLIGIDAAKRSIAPPESHSVVVVDPYIALAA